MEKDRVPRPGEIYNHFKDKPYQIITVATHTETGESMVVYQALYGDFKTYVRPLSMFISEVDKEKYPDARQKYRFELRTNEKSISEGDTEKELCLGDNTPLLQERKDSSAANKDTVNRLVPADKKEEQSSGDVNAILLHFLDATSYTKKLEVITSNMKHMTDRLINDMAVSLDCTVNEGPLEQRVQELIFCLQAMRRFEDRRLR